MKRIGAVISLIVLTVMLSGMMAFAGNLELVSTTPKENSNAATVNNMMIKLKFSQNVSSEKAQKANAKSFVLKNPDDKVIGLTPYYNSERYPNEIWLAVNGNLEAGTQYTLLVDKGLQSSTGDTLAEPITFVFGTRDINKDARINMTMMLVMLGGMVVFSVWDTRRRLRKEQGKDTEDEKINPYKEAKKTGKSVEEIVAKAEKEKEKQRIKEERRANEAKPRETKETKEETVREGVKKVAVKRPISAVGGVMPSAIAEERRKRAEDRKEAERKKNKKNVSSPKKKGSKQQQRKRKN
ncbi:MAG: Ig-like domain-containing protein [Anaerovoracaceae bacterium]|jgi:hypothetical protein